jgi:hypothetical protein
VWHVHVKAPSVVVVVVIPVVVIPVVVMRYVVSQVSILAGWRLQ